MFSITAKSNYKQIARRYKGAEARHVRPAAATAINKTATQTRNKAASLIAKRVGVPVKAVKDRLKVGKAATARTLTRLVVSLVKPLPVDKMAHRVTKKGVRQRKRFYAGHFKGKGKIRGKVFHRTTDARLPIKRTAVSIEKEEAQVTAFLKTTFAPRKFIETFEHELRRRLKRAGLL